MEVIDRASAGGAITQDVNYYYDAENRWIGETVSIPGQAVQDTSYAYCGNQVVLQFDGASSTSPLGVANLSNRYLWGPAVDQILAGEQVTDPTEPGNVLLPLTDNLGTVRDLVQYNAGTGTTTVVDHLVYDSFGNLVSQTNAAVDFLFGYTGQPFHQNTGLQINGERIYRPSTGDWMSQDPTGFTRDTESCPLLWQLADQWHGPKRYDGLTPGPERTGPQRLARIPRTLILTGSDSGTRGEIISISRRVGRLCRAGGGRTTGTGTAGKDTLKPGDDVPFPPPTPPVTPFVPITPAPHVAPPSPAVLPRSLRQRFRDFS